MREKIVALRDANSKRLAQLKKWQKTWDTLARETTTGSGDAAEEKALLAHLTGWADMSPEYRDTWIELESTINERYQDLMRSYEALFRDKCTTRNYHVTGEFPKFIVDGLIEVRIDSRANQATVNGKKTSSLALVRVLGAIFEEHQRLWERAFQALGFLQRLRAAYETIRLEKKLPAGATVSLLEVYAELKKKDSKYIRMIFAADLSRMLEEPTASKVIDLIPVRDPRRAILVYDRQTNAGRYLGLVRFTSEE